MTKTEVEKQVRALPEEEQIELAYSVLADVLLTVSDEEREELNKRWYDYKAHPERTSSWDKVKVRLAKTQ